LSGRRARLTDAGELLLRGARNLLSEAMELEALASTLAEGWEAEVGLAVDGICPRPVLMAALNGFSAQAAGTRVELFEEVLSGASEALSDGRVDLALAPAPPSGFLGEPIMDIAFQAVASPGHPLHGLDRALTGEDLSRQVQVVIRDSARRSRQDSGWLGSPRRWTVSSLATAREVVEEGTGFAWLPLHLAEQGIRRGRLKALRMQDGGGKKSHLYLVQARNHATGPAVQLLASCLRSAAKAYEGGESAESGDRGMDGET